MRGESKSELLIAAGPAGAVQAAFFVVPLLMTVALSFQTTEYFQVVWSWNFSTWSEVFSNSYYWSVLRHTITMSVISVVATLLLAFPIAYAMVMRLGMLENHVKILIIFAFLTDAVLKTYGWVLVLKASGPVNHVLGLMGLGADPVNILYTEWATLIGMVYKLLPFAIFTIYLSLLTMDRELLQAADDSGASRLRTLWEITLPLARPGIWAGAVLTFAISLGVFLPSNVLGGGTEPMIAELIRTTFETRVNWPLGAALTLLLLVVSVTLVMAFTAMYGARRRGG